MSKLQFRILVLMGEKRIRTASEFARRMTEAGFELSSSHATRYLKEDPPAFTLAFLEAACRVLECGPNDLLGWMKEQSTSAAPAPAVVAAKRPTPPGMSEIVGPKVTALPKPKKQR